jgi:hypothetical protein
MGLESFVWESLHVNMAMGPQIYSKKCTPMKESIGYKKALRSQAKETTKRLYVKTHLAISHEHILCAICV